MDLDFGFLALTFISGLAAGVLSSIAGVGGGLVHVPFFRIFLKLPAQVAVGTSLALVFFTALEGAIQYRGRVLVEKRHVVLIAAGGVVFSVPGALIASQVAGYHLMLLLSAFLVFIAVLLAFLSLMPNRPAASLDPSPKPAALFGIGSAAGFIGSLTGIGGGSIVSPSLMSFTRLSPRSAVAISLSAMAVYTLPAVASHLLLGHFNAPVFAVTLFGAFIGTRLGLKRVVSLTERDDKVIVAAIIMLLGVVLAANELIFAR